MDKMSDLLLDESHDLAFDGVNFYGVTGAAAVAQRIKIRLLTVFGEWKWDSNIGVDWFGTVFATEKTYTQKSGEIRKTISGTRGVRSLDRFEFGVDVKNRTARVRFLASTIYGDVAGNLSQKLPEGGSNV